MRFVMGEFVVDIIATDNKGNDKTEAALCRLSIWGFDHAECARAKGLDATAECTMDEVRAIWNAEDEIIEMKNKAF